MKTIVLVVHFFSILLFPLSFVGCTTSGTKAVPPTTKGTQAIAPTIQAPSAIKPAIPETKQIELKYDSGNATSVYGLYGMDAGELVKFSSPPITITSLKIYGQLWGNNTDNKSFIIKIFDPMYNELFTGFFPIHYSEQMETGYQSPSRA